jgi:hypothetical protein
MMGGYAVGAAAGVDERLLTSAKTCSVNILHVLNAGDGNDSQSALLRWGEGIFGPPDEELIVHSDRTQRSGDVELLAVIKCDPDRDKWLAHQQVIEFLDGHRHLILLSFAADGTPCIVNPFNQADVGNGDEPAAPRGTETGGE